ncbi:hypothetical protein MNBD_GAMMA21-1083 [hydrothermal vent metagenome]|uniref:Type IV fimbrial biogenesis protein PilW n=1 Tax=hydrothermal vent metagenome TaxID=652676 RepID=A0A3B1ACN6_9ZZZZ
MANTMTRIMKNTSRLSGVTLIELIVAVTISSVLLLGVGSVYYNSKRTYNVQQEFAQLQEGARFAVRFMVDDIRMAGFVGCAYNNDFNQAPKFVSFLNGAGTPENDTAIANFAVAITGYEATTSGPGEVIDLAAPPAAYSGAILPNFFNPPPLPGSDILIARFAGNNSTRLNRNKVAANFSIADVGAPPALDANNCNPASGICQGQILLATNCQKVRLFQATALVLGAVAGEIDIFHDAGPALPGNAVVLWGGAASPDTFEVSDTYLFQAVSNAYYVAINPNGEPSLYRMEMQPGAVANELINGVESMQILYGIDTDKNLLDGNELTDSGDGTANAYVTANNVVAANENIVSVRISLLIRTTNEVSTKSTVAPVTQNYLMAGISAADGTTVTSPADRRQRKVFTTTVKLRNKGIP